MKRRLPMTNQGEFVLVERTDPPHTDEQKRHGFTDTHPGNAHAARHALSIAPRAKASGSETGVGASSPRSTHSAAKATASRWALAENRLTQPRAVVCGTPMPSAAGRTPLSPPTTDLITWPIDSI
jgi:hypothetical protein